MANIGSIVQQMRYHCVLYYIYLLTCDILLTYHLCAGRTLLSGIPFSVVEYIAPQFLLVIESIPCCCSGLHLFSSVYWHFPYNCMQLDNYSCLITQCYWITRSIMKSPFHPKSPCALFARQSCPYSAVEEEIYLMMHVSLLCIRKIAIWPSSISTQSCPPPPTFSVVPVCNCWRLLCYIQTSGSHGCLMVQLPLSHIVTSRPPFLIF